MEETTAPEQFESNPVMIPSDSAEDWFQNNIKFKFIIIKKIFMKKKKISFVIYIYIELYISFNILPTSDSDMNPIKK